MATIFTYPISNFASGISVEDFINEIKKSSISISIENVEVRASEANGSKSLADMTANEAPQDLTVYIYFDSDLSAGEETTLDNLVTAHVEPIGPPTGSDAEGIVTFFMKHLLSEGVYSKEKIKEGMLTTVFSNEGSLPNPPPSGASVPAFAVIDDGYGVEKLAYWNFNSQSSWKVTYFSWVNPINDPQWIIKQSNSIGSGDNVWKYAMGPEFRILAPADGGTISNFSVKFSKTEDHAWAIRRSTVVGENVPALSSYTEVVASGTYENTKEDSWETISGFSPIVVAENEWYIAQVFIGKGGQSFSFDSPNVNEKLVKVYSGTYASIGGSNPGSTAVPTSRNTSAIYGLCAVEITPK